MTLGAQICFLMFWLFSIFTCALLLFTKGFLLRRIVIESASSCEENNHLINNLWSGVPTNMKFHAGEMHHHSKTCGRTIKPVFKKMIFVIIDGLRYDFLQYDENLNKTKMLAYQNKMRKVHNILKAKPQNGKLFRFEADPPTTTMQRIKGLTTGSLPTFIDASTNFDSYRIVEDNIIDHTVRQKKNISFMGCSTWTELYPDQFHRQFSFSALNVKDIDSADYGVIKNLYPELKRTDWSIIIAHFLGVDHCGHRYSTDHPEMARKLTEMDNEISNVMELMDKDTILFVMGDHGMTVTGDHGGDSKNEVMAGLLAYSKKELFRQVQGNAMQLSTVSQIDLVPTMSILLDLPIPYSNLGSIIPEFLEGSTYLPPFAKSKSAEKYLNLTESTFRAINKLYAIQLNCAQMLQYTSSYKKVSGDLPMEKLEIAEASFEFAEDKFAELLDRLVFLDWSNATLIESLGDVIHEDVLDLEQLYSMVQDVLQSVKQLCKGVWAKFEMSSIYFGLTLMTFVSITTFVSPALMSPSLTQEQSSFQILISVVGFAFTICGYVYLAVPFENTEMASFVVFLTLSFSYSLWLLACGVSFNYNRGGLSSGLSTVVRNKACFFFLVCFVGKAFSLLSDSYTIYEDAAQLFLLQSIVIFYALHCLSIMVDLCKAQCHTSHSKYLSMQMTKRKIANLCINRQSLKFVALVFALMLCLRGTSSFWFCREMQLTCTQSMYSMPFGALLSEFSESHAHERLLVAGLSLTVFVGTSYFFIRQRGNLKGSSSVVVAMKMFGFWSVLIVALHWYLQLALTDRMSAIFDMSYLQQIILPRIVYVFFIVVMATLSMSPLSFYVVYRNKRAVANEQKSIPELYNQLRENFSRRPEDDKPPLVFGLQTVYTTAFITLAFILTIICYLVLSDGMALPATMVWLASYCMLGLFSMERLKGTCTYVELIRTSVPWVFFGSCGFFGTGHQTTLPGIRFPAAYVGFKGSELEMFPQVLVVVLNTFATQIVCALSLPLLLISRRVLFGNLFKSDSNEADLVEADDTSRSNLFRLLLTYMSLLMFNVSAAAWSAGFHRRHLMVWKVFAPRFLFEAASFLVVVPIMLLGFGFYLRIDNCLRRWMKEIALKSQ